MRFRRDPLTKDHPPYVISCSLLLGSRPSQIRATILDVDQASQSSLLAPLTSHVVARSLGLMSAPHDINIACIREQAASALGSPQAADDWLAEPALALGGRSPANMLETAEGLKEVSDLLVRMEFGVYI
ncbi:antitoxin Xre/MbcA/ParS toxin-binding domain-containing protein [Frigidibacter sp. MR17.24]|uniref:antitoxin Xre/MbcA/ParS toxin-binding domain-containing protein n=1 Tax=Frigidibacter sp. MR17.24 TaxID=3127345 RepID=UPI003FA52A60